MMAVSSSAPTTLYRTRPVRNQRIDSIDNDVDNKYIGAPIRLYVIDADGRLTYVGDRGPRGFDPESWVDAIEEQIKATATA